MTIRGPGIDETERARLKSEERAEWTRLGVRFGACRNMNCGLQVEDPKSHTCRDCGRTLAIIEPEKAA